MSVIKVKEEESLLGDESELWKELDIRNQEIERKVKVESSYGNLICLPGSMLLPESYFKMNLIK